MSYLYFVKIKEEYITYLRSFDSKVQDNSSLKNNKPYIGVLIEKENQKYFAPLSSPKEKHIIFDELYNKNKLPIDVLLIKDKDKTIGVINFNNTSLISRSCNFKLLEQKAEKFKFWFEQ